MRFLYIIFLSVIGVACYGKTSKKLENGVYHDESGVRLIEIKNDTLKCFTLDHGTSGEAGMTGGLSYYPTAICQITEVSNTFFEINSIEGLIKRGVFKDISITEEASGNNAPYEISFEVPNAYRPIKFEVRVGTNLYSGVTEKGKCTIVLDRNGVNPPESFSFSFQPKYYVESSPAGQYFGVLCHRYPYEVNLDSEKNIVIKLPNITDILFYQYYIFGEYIQVLHHGIKWRGDYYKKFRTSSLKKIRIYN